MTELQGVSKRWSEATSDPLADIAKWREQMMATSCRPNTIIMPRRHWRTIYRVHYRLTHGKRAWRRHRGKLRAAGAW